MIIKSLTSERKIKHAVISLDYDEIKIITNLMYEKVASGEADKETYDLYTHMYELTGLVKEGVVYRTTIKPNMPKEKGTPVEENDSGYNCENWIP